MKSNLVDHVLEFNTYMNSIGITPTNKYRGFHVMPLGGARKWYNKLASGNIISQPKLKNKFIIESSLSLMSPQWFVSSPGPHP